VRSRARAAGGPPGPVPPCFLSAANRPHLTIAVSEKRRREGAGINGVTEPKEMP
jgi:hypothetical protein